MDYYDYDLDDFSPADFKDYRDFFLAKQMQEGDMERRLILNDVVDDVNDINTQHFSIIPYIINRIMFYNLQDKRNDLDTNKRKPIILYIDAPGGDVIQGYALIDIIQKSKTPVYTVAYGMCASMAFLIFLAGHKRLVFPHAVLLMHDGQTTISGTGSKAEDQMEFNKKLKKATKEYVLAHSTMSSEKYDEQFPKEMYMLPEEALAYGFADGIVDDLDEVL